MNRREFVSVSLGSAFQISRPNLLIERAREAAFGILKPSRSQLEHGLALHADAVVIDCYGFSPRAAIDQDALGKAIDAGASAGELDVLTEEMRVLRCLTDTAERREYMDAWNAAGVTCIVESAGEESQDPMRLIRRMARFRGKSSGHHATMSGPGGFCREERNRRLGWFKAGDIIAARRVPMVIWVASYPRSGNTFFRLLLNRLYRSANWSVYENEPTINALLSAPEDKLSIPALAASLETHFVKTHEMPSGDEFPAIYLVRDGRDAVVSFAHYVLSLRGVPVASDRAAFLNALRFVITHDLYGGWSPNVIGWLARKGRTAVVEYSELVASPIETVQRALGETGVDRQPQAADVPGFAELQKLNPWFFRKGQSGSWQSEMPEDLHELFWKHHSGAMELLGYGDSDPVADPGHQMASATALAGEPELMRGRAFRIAVGRYTLPSYRGQPAKLRIAAGKGATDAQARAGCAGEAAERVSACWRGSEPVTRASFRQIGERAVRIPDLTLVSDLQFQNRDDWNRRHEGLDWIPSAPDEDAVMDWSRVKSLTHGTHREVPSAFCYFQHPERRLSCVADSVGCAAGESFQHAIVQAFLELVERDAVAIWWYNRLSRPAIFLESFGNGLFASFAARLCEEGRTIHVLDLTTDLGIPAAAAVSACDKRQHVVLGFGAHFDPSEAVRRALAEVDQTLTLHLDKSPAAAAISKASLDAHPYLQPGKWISADRLPAREASNGPAQVDECVCVARRHGLEVLALELTREDIGMPVARVIVPGLRPAMPRFAPGRLYEVPVKLGWTDAPATESQLNPLGMWL